MGPRQVLMLQCLSLIRLHVDTVTALTVVRHSASETPELQLWTHIPFQDLQK